MYIRFKGLSLSPYLALVLSLSLSAFADEKEIAAAQKDSVRSGNEMIEKIRKEYDSGEYQVFLKKMHEEYQRAGKAGLFRGLVDQKKKIVFSRYQANLPDRQQGSCHI